MGCSLSIQRTCLNPHFSLRMQMFLSFGITALIAISAFVLIGLYTTSNSGESVRAEATAVLEEAIRYSLGRSAQYVAETMAKKFANLGGTLSHSIKSTHNGFWKELSKGNFARRGCPFRSFGLVFHYG